MQRTIGRCTVSRDILQTLLFDLLHRLRFGQEPIVKFMAILPPAPFVQLIGTLTNLLRKVLGYLGHNISVELARLACFIFSSSLLNTIKGQRAASASLACIHASHLPAQSANFVCG